MKRRVNKSSWKDRISSSLLHKMLLWIGAVISISLVLMLIIFIGLTDIRQALQKINKSEELDSAAYYEMEINAINASWGVLMYLHSGEFKYLDQVAKNEGEFERLLVQYQQLADNAQEKALSEKIAHVYREYKNLGETLIKIKDQLIGLSATVSANHESAYTTIDKLLQSSIAERKQVEPHRLSILIAMHSEIAKVSKSVDDYLLTLNPRYRRQIYADSEKFWEQAAKFQRLDLNSEDERRSIEIRTRFQKAAVLIENIFAQTNSLREKVENYLKLTAEMDNVLDQQIRGQERVNQDVVKEKADLATLALMQILGVIIVSFILLGLGAVMLIIRAVKGPLQEIKNGTQAVSRGELHHRIPVKGQDDLAQIARSFNHLVAKLEATMVLKQRIKKSKEKLHLANLHLQNEVDRSKQREKVLQALSR